MARLFNGSTQRGSLSKAYLSAAAGPWTISFWFKPANLTQSASVVMQSGHSGGANYWQIDWENGTNNALSFYSNGYTGTNPATSSTIVLDSTHVSSGAWCAYRYMGQGLAWDKFLAGTKTSISSSISFTLPTAGAQLFEVSALAGVFLVNASIAEIAIWQAGLTDEQLAEVANGVAADVVAPGGLVAYWPFRGNTSPEPNYVTTADVITLTSAPTIDTHPTIVAPKLADVVEPVWVVDILHDTTPIKAATTDCDADQDVDTLGAFYTSLLADDIEIAESLPDIGAGVVVPSVTTITIQNTSGTVSRTQEWRQVPVKVRYYDRASHALVTEFTGVIAEADISRNRASFRCSSLDTVTLNQLVPRALVEVAGTAGVIDDTNGATRRSDVGLPIPYTFGTALVNPPFIVEDTTSSLGGGDFLVDWSNAAKISAVWFDYDTNTPGLEAANTWDTDTTSTYGPLTSISGTAFGMPTSSTATATTHWYFGRPVRYTSASAGTAYSHVMSVSGTICTIADSILPTTPTAFGTIDMGNDYSVDNTRYKYLYSGGSVWMKSMRVFAIDAAPIVQVVNNTNANPAAAINFILSDANIGLGETVDSTSVFTAGAYCVLAGIGGGVNGALGADRAQRRAIDVINELAMFRGMRVWKDADTASWMIEADSEPASPVLTFEYGEGTRNNISEVVSITRTPLDQAISSLKMKYAPMGRARRNAPLELMDYAYTASTNVLSVGGEHTMYMPWIRDHETAARVLYYIGKRLARSDERVTFKTYHEGRRVEIGDVVTLTIDLDGDQISGNYRVVARQRDLTEFTFVAVGPYVNDIYTTTLATINAAVSTPSGDINPDEREGTKAVDANLLFNPDLAAKTTVSRPFDDGSNFDQLYVPGWTFRGGSAVFSSISVIPSIYTRGGNYLTTTTTGGTIRLAADLAASSHRVSPDTTYVASIYTDTHPSKWLMRATTFWLDVNDPSFIINEPLGTVTVPARLVPGDTNQLGWKRYYGVFRVTSSTAPVILNVDIIPTTGGSTVTYKWDAAQLEQQTRLSLRPTPWHRNASFGIQPAQLNEGDVTIRPAAMTQTTQHGTKVGTTNTAGTTGVAFSGATVTIGTAPAGLVSAVTARVKSGITFSGGGASWRIGTTADPTLFGTALGTAAGGTVGDAHMRVAWVRFGTATPIIATPNTGSFTGGTVVATIHHITHPAPTG